MRRRGGPFDPPRRSSVRALLTVEPLAAELVHSTAAKTRGELVHSFFITAKKKEANSKAGP